MRRGDRHAIAPTEELLALQPERQVADRSGFTTTDYRPASLRQNARRWIE